MAERRKYSAKQRAEAVGIAAVEGVTRAEESTGIPKETIHYWLQKPEFARLRTTAREEVEAAFWIGIQVGLEEVTTGLRGDAPLKDKAAALQVLYDRHALMTGQATSRTESRSITEDLPADDKRRIREWIDSLTAAGDPAGDPV